MSDQQNATQVVPQQTTAPTTDKKDANPNAAQTVADNTQVNNEANPESKAAPLEGEELIKALVQQVETIFSRENLMSDYNIVSKMNGDMCVAISVVLESPRISKLTQDASHLLTAMRQTTKVILDEAANTVKPSFKLQRNTIIIRDVAPDTPQEDLKNIFDNLKDKITGIHSDVGNTWFITFADEDSTTDAFLLSRSKQFQGKPVQARVKSENLLKSVYYQPPAQTYQPQQSQQNGGFVANRGTAGQQQNGATNGWWNNTNNTQRPPNSNYKGNNYNPNYKNTRYAGANPGRGGHTGTRPPRDVVAPTTAPVATAAPTKRPSRSNSNASRPKKPAGSSTPPLGPSHFPPLPTSAKKSNGKEVQQWTKEEILAVVTALSAVEKPEFNANLSDCPAIRETANTELDITKTLTVDLRLEVLEPKNKEAKRKQRSRANSRKMSVGPGDNPYAQEHRNRSKSITNKPQQPAAAKQPVGATNSTVAKPNEKENHNSHNTEHHAPVENHHVEVKPKTTSATMSYADIARPSANSPQPVPQRVQKESAEQQAQAAQQAKQQQQKQQQQQQETKPRKQSDPNQFKRPKKTAKTNNGPKPSNTNAVAPKDAKPATAAQPKQAAATPAANKPVETTTPSTAAPEVNSSEATAVTNNA